MLTYQQIRETLLSRQEIAIVDVREEAPFAEAHPLFAANIPYSRIETDAYTRIPRRDTLLVIYDNGEGLASAAVNKFIALGYTNVHLLDGDLEGWQAAGGEIFGDVNSPSKAFGELVESKRHTPSLSAQEVKNLIDTNADVVIMDARRYEEYNTMNIPTGISVPGAELVLHARELAPDPETLIIVNCAGRTRSIIGTQSLINAGIPNRVVALRNGTIGWVLADQQLEHGQRRQFISATADNSLEALQASRKVADSAGVKRASLAEVQNLLQNTTRTTYRFDVRLPEAYVNGHLPGFASVQGGQLVQETDHYASVRGARIVLFDDNGTRSNMSASWLAQMGWEVYVLDGVLPEQLAETGTPKPELPLLPKLNLEQTITAEELADLIKQAPENVQVVDFATGKAYAAGHIPGAWFALRSQLADAITQLPEADLYVLTSPDGVAAQYIFEEFQAAKQIDVLVLDGGTASWTGRLEKGESRLASPVIDRYRRPYEGTNNPVEAMQGYLQWEYGLVAQLERDGTHGFFVI